MYQLVSVNPTTTGKIKAFLTVKQVQTGMILDGLKVINGTNGYFIGMPSRKVGEEWQDIIRFEDGEQAKAFKTDVLALYLEQEQGNIVPAYQEVDPADAPPNTPPLPAPNSNTQWGNNSWGQENDDDIPF